MPLIIRKYLTKTREVVYIDNLMSVAAIIHPLTAVPQVYRIYSTHNVVGVSIWTWLGFMTLGVIFLAYGLVHKIKPFIITQVLWFIVDALVVSGVIIYGK